MAAAHARVIRDGEPQTVPTIDLVPGDVIAVEEGDTIHMMSTVHTDAEVEGRVLVFTKGAPDALLPRCSHELAGAEWRPLSETRRR
jgi:magnesium-transporting ATPase (P-type)